MAKSSGGGGRAGRSISPGQQQIQSNDARIAQLRAQLKSIKQQTSVQRTANRQLDRLIKGG